MINQFRSLAVCRVTIAFAIAFAALILLAGSAVRAQDGQPAEVIKVYSNLVSVPVIVSDRDGRYIPGLRLEDFKLYDNNTEQRLSFFDAAEEPLNVALLLDTSRSTQGVLKDIKKAARNFLKELRPQDRAMIVCFDYDVHKLSALTSDRKVLEGAIQQAEVGTFIGTVLNDAVFESIERDLKSINGRKAIILLTDGEDAGSRLSQSELLAYASESDAMIYSIYYAPSMKRPFGRDRPFPGRGGRGGRSGRGGRGGIFGRLALQPGQGRPGPGPGQQRRMDRSEEAKEFLAKLSEVSAGRFYQSKTTDLQKTFGLIAQELRDQYRLGFVPDSLARDGSLHAVKVKVNKPEVAVRSRTQYRAARSE
jgi:VWFA-related protein